MSVQPNIEPTIFAGSLALALFDGAAEAHGLPARARHILDLAERCYAATRASGDDRPERAGRDLVLEQRAQLDADDLAVAASAVALQREKVRPNREPAFLRLGRHRQQMALRLAALLRVASALEGEPAGRVIVRADGGETTLAVPAERAAAADQRASLWRDAIGPLRVRAATPEELASSAAASAAAPGDGERPLAELPALTLGRPIGDEPVAEAARRMLRRFFDKLLAREDAVIKGEDIEDIHQMRVSTRRLRASLQVVEGVYEQKLIRRYRRGLRRIATSLGAVRDCDVFLEHVVAYRDSLPEFERASLEPLVTAVATERAQARQALLADLASKRYDKLKRDFAEFLTTPGAGALPPPEPGIVARVRDFAGSALWRRYELWRAYETVLPGAADAALHQARIAGKRLRYTVEFFVDALGPGAGEVLTPLVDLQECLGNLQDVVTAREHVATLGLADDPGAQAYLAARAAERETYLAELPARWEAVDGVEYRRRLFELIVEM